MANYPWIKYLFVILGIALVIALVAKFVTPNVLILIPLAIGLYWILFNIFIKSRKQ